jgi:hypothetical protein
MDALRNITIHIQEKYLDTAAYAPVALGVYKDLKKDHFCLCLEADRITQYPLRSMMEQYSLEFVRGESPHEIEVPELNKSRWIAEMHSRDTSERSLMKILHCATAAGKNIVNFRLSGYDVLGVEFGMSNCTINGQKIEIPLIGSRDDLLWGDMTFYWRYPEPGLMARFTGGGSMEYPQISEKAKIRAVVMRRYFAYLIYMEKQINKALVFNDKNLYKQIEDEKLVDEVMRGEIYCPE